MAKRILPYRDYSEHDVVNMFFFYFRRNWKNGFQSFVSEAGSRKVGLLALWFQSKCGSNTSR